MEINKLSLSKLDDLGLECGDVFVANVNGFLLIVS